MAEDMEVDEGPVRHLLPLDSVKMMGESVGVTSLSEDVATRLGEDLEYRLKEIVQGAVKFMRHSKRRRLVCSDIDHAMRAKNIEPLYGFDRAECPPFRHATVAGKELYFPDDREVDLIDLINSPLPRLPQEVTLRAHWLAVEGVQPAVPENPPLATLDEQKKETIVAIPPPSEMLPQVKESRLETRLDKRSKKKEESSTASSEWSKLKPLQAHALSLEQQLYYKEITDACIGLSDSKRQEALTSLSTDSGLYQLLPQLCNYITEGIKVNIAQRKLHVLKHLLKMVKALLDNQNLSLEKYLHELIPSVTTCLLNRHLCIRAEAEDHWSLRDSAAKILGDVCKKYSNSVNNIQTRLTRILSQALNNTTQGLAVHYGAVACVVELGQESLVTLVIPRLKAEGELIKAVPPSKLTEHIAATKLQSLLSRHCAPHLMASRPVSDTVQHYQESYGHLGALLFSQVKILRQNRASLSHLPLHHVGVRVQTASLKSPTTPTTLAQIRTNRPPPLHIPSPQLTVVRASPSGSPRLQTPLSSLSSPTITAALRLVTQATSPSTGSPVVSPASSISASLLSAVMSHPTAAQAVLASQLSSALVNSVVGQQKAEQKATTATTPTSSTSTSSNNSSS